MEKTVLALTATGLTARVLIVARDEAIARPLALGLDQAGWRSVTAKGVNSGLIVLQDFPIEAVIVILGEDEAVALETALRLKSASSPRRLPVLAIGRPENAPAEQEGFDLVLAAPLSAAQAAQRLEQLVRAAISEEELELRRATFADQGGRLERPRPDPRPLRVLAIGEPAPSFLGLSNVLKQHGVEVTGAFTPYTAFDYLHDRAFDAAVLWGGATHDEALSIAAGLRRNSRLYHLPTLLYLRSSAEIDLADAYRRGLTDVAGAETPEGETALRVIALAKAYRREIGIRQALERARGSGLMDAETGLFTRELFAAHLSRLAAATRERARPLSVAVLRVADRPEVLQVRAGGWLTRALPQIGSMVARLVRAEDTAARIAPEVFALALPASGSAARSAAERISAVIACTAFHAGDGQPAFTVDFEIGVAEIKPGEGVARALERAAAGSLGRKAG